MVEKTPVKTVKKTLDEAKVKSPKESTNAKNASLSKSKFKSKREKQRARFSDMGIYYMHYNDPKHKARLSIYDKRPLIYPLSIERDSLLAINLHWINPVWRVKFVIMLNKASKKLKNKRKFVRWTYEMFKNDPKLRYAQPAIRRYINKRIKYTQRITREELNSFTLMKTKYRSKKVKGGK